MEILVYYPKEQSDVDILRKRVAAIHAEAVLKYIEKLSCPKEQKIELLNSLIATTKGLPR